MGNQHNHQKKGGLRPLNSAVTDHPLLFTVWLCCSASPITDYS